MNRDLTATLLGVLFSMLIFAGHNPGAWAAQAERILVFDSHIQVAASGALTVTENIRVISAGQRIRHGIYRDFPTRYTDRHGRTHRVGFKIIRLLRDGRPEAYHIRQMSNGLRIYMGKKNRRLPPGTHTYTLTYRSKRQIGFFADYDELYWNVTGNGWAFAIDKVRAVVALPPGAEAQQQAAYTGRFGSKGQSFVYSIDDSGNPVFVTTRTLAPREGLTIAVAWPKGFVAEPTRLQRLLFGVEDNLGFFLGLAGLALVLFYYALAWLRVGRDPARGTVIPLFAPPEGFSPAAARFVRRMGFDHKAFAAAVVDLAVKGALKIEENEKKIFTLEKRAAGRPNGLSKGERKILEQLFGTGQRIALKNTNHTTIQAAVRALKKSLNAEFARIFFRRNSGYLVPGIGLSLATLGGLILTAQDVAGAAFMGLWLGMWTAGCTLIGIKVVHAWRIARGIDLNTLLPGIGAVVISLFALPFFGGEIFGLILFARAVTFPAALLFLLIITLNVLFYHLIKAPTLRGRRIMDQIDGFRQFLSVAEKERLNILNPPDKTPELFEKYLPYALALDVENQWSEQFADVLAASGGTQDAYRPAWYAGTRFSAGNLSGFASGLGGAFAGAISAASQSPGSSSGSGGGGFSGGGGGGGGGGGW